MLVYEITNFWDLYFIIGFFQFSLNLDVIQEKSPVTCHCQILNFIQLSMVDKQRFALLDYLLWYFLFFKILFMLLKKHFFTC